MKKRYTKTKWVDGKTCVGASLLNKIENGIDVLYQNAIEESQLKGGDGISIEKDEDNNIVIGVKEENDFIQSSGVGRIEITETTPEEPDPACLYLIKDPTTGKFDIFYSGIYLFSSMEIPKVDLTGEIEITNINPETGEFSVIYLGEEEGVTMTIKIDGQDVGENPVLRRGWNYIQVILGGEAYNTKVITQNLEWIPQTSTPIITFDEETLTVEATGEGVIVLKVGGEEVTNPYTFVRQDQEMTYTITATAKEEDKLISEVAAQYITIPAKPELQGTIIVSEPSNEGVINISYNGDEGNSTITIDNYTIVNGSITLPEGEYGEYTITVRVLVPGYKILVQEFTIQWLELAETPNVTITPDPEETLPAGEDIVIDFEVTESISYSITIDGGEVVDPTLPFTVESMYGQPRSVQVIVTNAPEGMKPSQVIYNFTIPAKPSIQTPQPTFIVERNETTYTITAKVIEEEDIVVSINNITGGGTRAIVSNPYIVNRAEVGGQDRDITLRASAQGPEPKYIQNLLSEYEDTITILAQEYSKRAIEQVSYDDEKFYIWFTGNVIKVYVEDENSGFILLQNIPTESEPYEVLREQETITKVFQVVTKDEACLEKSTDIAVDVLPIYEDLGGTLEVTQSEPYSRTWIVSYTGEESGIEILVEGQDVDELSPAPIPQRDLRGGGREGTTTKNIELVGDLGPYSVTVTVTAPERNPLVRTFECELRDIMPSPVVTFSDRYGDDGETIIGKYINVTGYSFYSVAVNGTSMGSIGYVERTYNDKTITVTATKSSDEDYVDSAVVNEEVVLEGYPKTKSPAAEFSTWMDENTVYFNAIGDGCMLFYQNPDESEVRPMEFSRPEPGEESIIIPAHTFYATTWKAPHEQYSETTTWYEEDLVIPAKPQEFEINEFSGEILCSEPTEEGVVTITYTGNENVDIVYSVVLNSNPTQLGENNTLQLEEGINIIGVIISATGYDNMSKSFEITWGNSNIEPEEPENK